MSDVTPRLNAALEGRYRIERDIGEGGMATVYLADDIKHNRKVALKVLKPELAAVVGAERFLAEIEVTANLQHPHILPLYDSGEADTFLYYVMPYVDGESLQERLDSERQLPVDEAVSIATDLAEALDYAHRHGVIHRDIKPANVMMHEGRPLIADFGIALAVGAAGGTRLTETGLSVGTPFYMSPEQATGDQVVGPASDTYALGCVLFEMLTGDPPYQGSTAQAVLGKIIQGEPVSATQTRNSVPLNVDAAMRKALEKLPADRFPSAKGFALALEDDAFRHGELVGMGAGAASGRWKVLTAALAVVAAVATTSAAMLAMRPDPPTPVIRYSLTFPEGQRPMPAGQGQFGVSMAMPDDGSRLAYIGSATDEDRPQLWLRDRNQLDATPLRGTEGAHQPFFSPDGTRVGYITEAGDRELKVVSLGGEPPLTLVDADIFRLGGGWGRDGYIYFSQMPHGGIARVAATGGEVEQLSTPDTEALETRHAWPAPLPGGRGVIVTVQRGNNAYHPDDDVGVLDIETGEVTVLFRANLARYVATGHLLFVTHDGDLAAAPFDEERLEVTGPTVPLQSGMPTGVRGPDVALSLNGRLVYSAVSSVGGWDVVWVDRSGNSELVEEGWAVTPTPERFALSPDERRIAVTVAGADSGSEVWIKEIGGPFSRLAFEGSSGNPAWSVDGRSVLYSTERQGDRDLFTRRADGSSPGELVVDLETTVADGEWSRDGEWLLMRVLGESTSDIYAMRPGVDPSPEPLIATEGFHELAPALSPDGRYIAYVSNESGASEVYVRPFPNVNDARWLISTDQGREPVWANSGDELFYKNVLGQVVAVSLSTDDGLEVIGRTPLFPMLVGDTYDAALAQFDVSSDDQRFLMWRAAGVTSDSPLGEYIVVENFTTELTARSAGG